METISMKDLHAKLNQLSGDEIILDVRTPEEFAEDGHIAGAINIPHDEIGLRAHELRPYKTIYIHCKMGGRARMATAMLAAMGFKNLVCAAGDGMAAWLESGLPVVKGTSAK